MKKYRYIALLVLLPVLLIAGCNSTKSPAYNPRQEAKEITQNDELFNSLLEKLKTIDTNDSKSKNESILETQACNNVSSSDYTKIDLEKFSFYVATANTSGAGEYTITANYSMYGSNAPLLLILKYDSSREEFIINGASDIGIGSKNNGQLVANMSISSSGIQLFIILASKLSFTAGSTTICGGGSSTTAPTITSISPNPAPIQSGRQLVTVNGSNFSQNTEFDLYDGSHHYKVDRNSSDSLGSRFTYISSQQIKIRVGLGLSPMTWQVKAKNPGTSYSNVYSLRVAAPQGLKGDDYPYKSYSPSGVDPWNFYYRQCTSFATWRLRQNGIAFHNYYNNVHWGNAHHWNNAAAAVGIPVRSTPSVGDIAYWEAYTNGTKQYGHVAYVAIVHGDGTITVEEYNWGTSYGYGTRRLSVNTPTGYIHYQ